MVWKGNSLLIFFLVCLIHLQLPAQVVEEQKVDSAWWKNKTDDLDYTEDEWEAKNFTVKDPSMDWINNSFVKYSILFIIVIVLLFILYKIYAKDLFSANNLQEKKAYHLLSEEDLDDRFLDMDLEKLLASAISNMDWKGAIRLEFLLTIKLLIQLEKIAWHKDLTNFQIVYQLSNTEERNQLSLLVTEFDKRWYGDQQAGMADYERFSEKAMNFKQLIKNSA